MRKETIILVPTTNCDVGCKHCMHCADMNGTEMPFEYLQMLIARLNEEETDASFEVTGMGEPLLYSDFDSMTKLIMEDYGASGLTVITSGYLLSEIKKKERLMSLLNKEYHEDVLVAMSFNMYANFEDRLLNFLQDLLSMKREFFLIVKICVTKENAEETVKSFERLLMKISTDHELRDVSCCGSTSWGINLPKYLKHQRYVVHGKCADIRIQTQVDCTKKEGRGSTLNETPFLPIDCEWIERGAKKNLQLYPDGYFYPCDRCVGLPKRRLGHVMTNSISDICKKRDIFINKVRKYIAPIWMFTDWLPCKLCRLLPR